MLVVSGCVAKKGKSTITWTVNDLQQSHSDYFKDCRDCKNFGVIPNRDHPIREELPYKNEDKKNLTFKPDQHQKIHLINVAKYYGNEEQFLELLRFVNTIFYTLIQTLIKKFRVRDIQAARETDVRGRTNPAVSKRGGWPKHPTSTSD